LDRRAKVRIQIGIGQTVQNIYGNVGQFPHPKRTIHALDAPAPVSKQGTP
jgi:hypothetical protein